MRNIKWDYYFGNISFEGVEKSALARIGLTEKIHLMWQFKGVPMFNSAIYNKFPSEMLAVKTDKRKFTIKRKLFDENINEWKNEDERQYYCDLFFWDVKDLEKPIT